MASFSSSRLDLARRRRGMTKAALAEKAGISTRILTAYERDEREPTDATIDRLAAALDFPRAFLLGSDIDEPSLEAASFRALSSLTARQRDQALGSAALAVTLADWIDKRFSLPAADVPRLRGVDPESAAEEVRTAWGLGQRPAPNMVHLLEAHGVRVFSLVEECAEVDAFSFWRDCVPFVFLNILKSAERSRMDAAHELGHLVLHWRGGVKGRRAEQDAQTFGAALLMPRASVLADAPRTARVDHVVAAKRRWRVAAINLAYRMRQVGLLSEWQARSMFIEMSKLGYRSSEPDPIPRETSQVLTKVFQSLREEGVSKADVARHLDLPLADLNKLIFGLVMTPVQGAGGGASPPRQPPNLRVV